MVHRRRSLTREGWLQVETNAVLEGASGGPGWVWEVDCSGRIPILALMQYVFVPFVCILLGAVQT